MSDRLALSATLSVLMMAAYVLFGSDAVRVPLGSGNLDAFIGAAAPHMSVSDRLSPFTR